MTTLRDGPLDGTKIDLGDDPPPVLAIGVSADHGGPGTVLYRFSRKEGEAAYRFDGWEPKAIGRWRRHG